ncbi:MAG: hypothetical protein D6805_01500 [Planctomycetota bacterium]|nr:MAG: hypothetical protein D6805_01500 [Planctomycetota bacterium]
MFVWVVFFSLVWVSPLMGGTLEGEKDFSLSLFSGFAFEVPPPPGLSSAKELEIEPVFPVEFGLSLKFGLNHLRGNAARFRNNDYSYDNLTDTGLGGELELSIRALPSIQFFVSVGFSSFAQKNGHFSLPNFRLDMEFGGWELTSILVGAKYYAFEGEEELVLQPYFRGALGVSVYDSFPAVLKADGVNLSADEKVRIFGGGESLTILLGFGVEWRFYGKFFLMVEGEVVIVETGSLLRGSDNLYALPLKFGAGVYF